MKWNLVYTKRAFKDIKSLDNNIQSQLKNGLEKLAQNPFKASIKLKDTELGSYRFRIGSYRVIFDIEGNDIVVLRVGHRKQIYRGGTS